MGRVGKKRKKNLIIELEKKSYYLAEGRKKPSSEWLS